MSKTGYYLGGHKLIRGPAPTSKDRPRYIGLLDNLEAYNASKGPAPKVSTTKVKKQP
jgi:hypothetical protein